MDLQLEMHLDLHIRGLSNSRTRSSSKIVKLLDNGRNVDRKNVNEKNKEGDTLLFRILQNQSVNSPAIVSFLLEKGALVTTETMNTAFERQVQTALNTAIRNMTHYSLDIVKILFDKNPPAVNTMDSSGMLPLHLAVGIAHESAIEIVKLLLERGADVNQKDGEGYKALHLAAENEHESVLEMVRLLLDKGADVNQKSRYGISPLHHAVQKKHESAPEIVRLLLEKGADINEENRYGHKPIHWAVDNKHESAAEIVCLLVKKGADVNQKGL